MLINRALFVSQMLSLFSKTNSAYIQIPLIGPHDKTFKISQRKLKIGEK